MITLSEFNSLEKIEQAVMLWEKGVYLGNRPDKEHLMALLFQIEGIYIEIFFHRQFGPIKKIRAFIETDQLEPYLGQIDISGMNQ